MTPPDIEKLLGGYATNTLSPDERTALFDAALGNQALFEALADEQALKELLDDPRCRRQLLETLEQKSRESWLRRLTAWAWQPPVIALASAVSVGLIVVASVKLIPRMTERPQVAMSKLPRAEMQPQPPVPAPAPQATAAAPEEKDEPRSAAKKTKEETAKPDAVIARNSPPPAAEPAAAPAAVPTMQPAAPVASEVQTADATPRNVPAVRTASARDLYYSPDAELAANSFASRPRTATRGAAAGAGGAPAVKTPGVRYSIMKRDADASFSEASPGTVFHAGDALRLRFEANQQGSVIVMQRDASATWTTRMTARLRQGEPVYMPAESTITLRQAGEIQLFVTFSREQQGAARAQGVSATPNLQQNADHSTYVVNPTADATAPVAFPVTLRFQ